MARIPKKVICLATVAVIICSHVPVAHAEALPNVLEGSATLADNIMSYYALSGSAVANTEWINTLYDSYGSSFGTIYDLAENGMLTINNDGTWQATTALETAIENAPAYQSLGLDQMFNVSSQEAAAGGGLAASGAATLAGSLGGVASTGVLPLFGSVTAAYWGGIAIGTLINHLKGKYDKYISAGAQITARDSAINLLEPGGRYYTILTDVAKNRYFNVVTPPGVWMVCYKDSASSNEYKTSAINGTDTPKVVKYVDYSNDVYQSSVGAKFYTSMPYSRNNYSDGMMVLSEYGNSAINNYWQKVKSGEEKMPKVFSPDIIGPNGNQEGNYDSDNNQYQVPDMKPQVDPGVQSGKPLTLQDWLNFANSVKNNNSNTNPLPDNKAIFDDVINAIKKAIPNPNPNPDTDPYHPPTPTPVPDPDYGDPNPDQPDFESETDIPDPVDTGNPWITPDLLEKFPFCIPKDMIDMVKGFKSADRTAPHISWNFKSPVGHVDYTFNLDLEDFEDVATLLRALELAAFIVGLAFATRYLIGAS